MATVYSLVCWGDSAGKTATMTIASPCVVTITSHGLRDGFGVVFTSSGSLPTGVTSGTPYYARYVSANTFHLYDTSAHAIAGGTTGRVDTSGTQSGTHTAKSERYTALSDTSRWTGGIYAGIWAWKTGRTNASPYDIEVCELYDGFTERTSIPFDFGGSVSNDTTALPSAKSIIISKVNGTVDATGTYTGGTRTDAWHQGTYPVSDHGSVTKGYVVYPGGFSPGTGTINMTRYNDVIDGFTIWSDLTGGLFYGVTMPSTAAQQECKNMYIVYTGAYQTIGISNNAPLSITSNNIISVGTGNSGVGISIVGGGIGSKFFNNVVTRCATGITAASSTATGFFYNNISVGNTTNWGSTNLLNISYASNNAGLSGEAWKIGIGAKRITIATSDFATYGASITSSCDFRPAAASSPQTETAAVPVGIPTSDISDAIIPNYVGALLDTVVNDENLITGKVYTVATVGATDWTTVGATSNAVTFTDSGDTVNWTGHTVTNGTPVYFSSITSTTGISVDTIYYVVAATANSFKVAATSGGAVLPLTTDGSGTVVIAQFKATGTASSTGTATLTQVADVGAYEYDWGEGLIPETLLTINNLQSGSTVKIYTSGTSGDSATVQASTSSSGTSYAPTGLSGTVDYTIMKVGYLPIRVTNVALTSGTNLTVDGTQTIDRSYVASSGLTYTTDTTATVGTKIFTLRIASTLQNFYAHMMETWISENAFQNVEFPIVANGSNSFTFKLGWEWRGWSTAGTGIANTSIPLLSRDGMRYLANDGTTINAIWSAILTSGVSSGMQVRFQQSDGGTTRNAAISSGNMDELVQVYGGTSYGNFDYRNYLICKVQESGYDQIETDVVSLYGTLGDELYVIGLSPLPNGLATGNPSLVSPPTITDHGASPVTWNSKSYSITITDSIGGNTGTEIMRWLRYYFELGGTFESKDTFNWHDLVQVNGTKFKTVRGKIYGDVGSSLKGVRVVQNDGSSAHSYFDLFTADDGTTYTPPTSVNVTVNSIISGSRIQIYDTTNNIELWNEIVSGTSINKSILYSSDINIRIRLMYVNGLNAYKWYEITGTITSSGFNANANQEVNTVYEANSVDGSLVTECSISVDGIDIWVDDPTNSTTGQRIYNWYQYYLFTEDGIRDSNNLVLATDSTHYVFDNTLQIRNLDLVNPLNILGANIVPTTGDATNVFDLSNGASIGLNFNRVEGFAYSSGSGLSTEEHNWLSSVNDKTANIQDGQDVATKADVINASQF